MYFHGYCKVMIWPVNFAEYCAWFQLVYHITNELFLKDTELQYIHIIDCILYYFDAYCEVTSNSQDTS